MKKALLVVAVLLTLVMVPSTFAQIQASQTINVTVNVSVNNTITLTETGGNLVIPNSASPSNQITLSAQYNLDGTNNALTLYTYFSSATNALAVGGSSVPSSAIQANLTNTTGASSLQGSASGFCTTSPGVGNGVVDGAACPSLGLISAGTNGGPGSLVAGTVSATLTLSIPNIVALRLPAGNYAGTLNAVIIAV